MSTLTVYPDAASGSTTCDGQVANYPGGAGVVWATLIAASGNFNDVNTTAGGLIQIESTTTTDQWDAMLRSIFTLDTSALTSSASISSAIFSIYGSTKADNIACSPTINVYDATPAVNNNLADGDFSQCGSTSFLDSSLTYSAWSTTGYNDFTFNATGVAAISKTGITKLSIRNANFDVAATSPTWPGGSAKQSYMAGNFADTADVTSDPKLVITYTILVGPANLKTWDGLATASVKTIDGLAMASVKTWNGLV